MYSCQSGPAPMSEPIFSSVNSYAFLTSSMPSGPLASFICTAQHRIRHHLVPQCPGTLPRELLGKLVCLPAVWLAGSCFGFLKPSISHCRALRHVIVDHAHACRMLVACQYASRPIRPSFSNGMMWVAFALYSALCMLSSSTGTIVCIYISPLACCLACHGATGSCGNMPV